MCKIVIYEDAERQVVAKRFRTPLAEKGKNWPEFAQEVRSQNILSVSWGIEEHFYHGEFNPDDVEYELMLPVAGEIQPAAPLKARILPAAKVASIIHRGPFDELDKAYDRLFKWIEEQGLKIAGNVRVVHLRCPHNTPEPAGYVTEIQVPVE